MVLILDEYAAGFYYEWAKSSATRMSHWIRRLTKFATQVTPNGEMTAMIDLKAACRLVIGDVKHWYDSDGPTSNYPKKSPLDMDDLLRVVIRGVIVLNDRELCAKALSLVGRRLPVLEVFDAIKSFGLSSLHCEYAPLKIRK